MSFTDKDFVAFQMEVIKILKIEVDILFIIEGINKAFT